MIEWYNIKPFIIKINTHRHRHTQTHHTHTHKHTHMLKLKHHGGNLVRRLTLLNLAQMKVKSVIFFFQICFQPFLSFPFALCIHAFTKSALHLKKTNIPINRQTNDVLITEQLQSQTETEVKLCIVAGILSISHQIALNKTQTHTHKPQQKQNLPSPPPPHTHTHIHRQAHTLKLIHTVKHQMHSKRD